MTRLRMPSERTRAYVYAVLTAAVPLLIGYGILTAEQAALWLGLAAAGLGLGMASANTSTRAPQSPPEVRVHVDGKSITQSLLRYRHEGDQKGEL